jgi:sugar (pentulose or hexulose) kinase
MKIKCNILNKRILLSSIEEASAVGAAALAAEATEELMDIKNKEEEGLELMPEESLSKLYERGYRRYKATYESMSDALNV